MVTGDAAVVVIDSLSEFEAVGLDVDVVVVDPTWFG